MAEIEVVEYGVASHKDTLDQADLLRKRQSSLQVVGIGRRCVCRGRTERRGSLLRNKKGRRCRWTL